MLEAVGRAKLASIVFDEVVIESGLHVVEMSAIEGPLIHRRSAERLSLDLLEHSRTVERGTKAGLAVRRIEDGAELYVGTNLPRLEDAFYLERDVTFRYVSEYHSGLLDDLAKIGADWVKVVELKRRADGGADVKECLLQALAPAGATAEPFAVIQLDPAEVERLGEELLAHAESTEIQAATESTAVAPHESMLAEDLREAILVGDDLEAVPALSTAFSQVASERGLSLQLPGEISLGFLVPNFSCLPWEAIAQFRDHPGAVDARGRLREFESAAAVRGDPSTIETVRTAGREVTSALLAVAKDLSPKLPEEARGPIIASTVSLIPVVGQYTSLAVSMGDLISALRRHQQFEGSWVAAILELRDAAIDTLVDW